MDTVDSVQSALHISKINIQNFKSFRKFSLSLNNNVNILVGNNEAGKSTILEAIHIVLTGIFHGRYIKQELSQYFFNKDTEKEYLDSLLTNAPEPPPQVLIEIFLKGNDCPELALFQGASNSEKADESGIYFSIEFDQEYRMAYEELLKTKKIKTIPIEYYKIILRSFAGAAITGRNIPIKSVLIDSASSRGQNGSDLYVSRIIKENLNDKQRVDISQAHRQMKESFMENKSILDINSQINKNANISGKNVQISVDLATQNAWENSLMTYIDDIPFQNIGKGEQSVVKTNLALSHKKSQAARVILLEEPENNLSHSKLNELMLNISAGIIGKQVVVSTHSSFVANKLDLDNLVFINDTKSIRLAQLSSDTRNFFKKLPGYNTLRLILCKKAILVEGDSDELIVQKAYMKNNGGKLPIHNGIDVISVGTSFLRFLEIAQKINLNVTVVTDNDGNVSALQDKYSDYLSEKKKDNIKICFEKEIEEGDIEGFNYNTLEPLMLKMNGKEALEKIIDKYFKDETEMLKHMHNNKTSCALKIFDSSLDIQFPQYILEAIEP